jgi:sodium transport system permease protein
VSFHRRIRTVYWKELIDILRDHRTLIAMIVVPIVLYPLLLLGSIQAVSYQAERFEEEEVIVGVINEAQGLALDRLIRADAAALGGEGEPEPRASARAMEALSRVGMVQGDDDDAEAGTLPRPLERYKITALGSVEAIEKHVSNRTIHLGVVFEQDVLFDAPEVTNQVRFLVDHEHARGHHAFTRVRDVFERTAERTLMQRVADANLPPTFVQPFQIEAINLAAPQSVLGQVLPLILILMTITGAIYPAIDLTAGERERGTLESLMVCPVPVFDVIAGKFLVVTTVAIMGAALNLASVGATVYFGGFSEVIAPRGGGLPLGSMVFILLCLIPFAVFMSAIMIAVCSFARTFKEAQNYVTPVILAVLIPGGLAALPTTRFDGVMLVMPVGNMVLLAREFLVGAAVPWSHVLMVLLSTTLYAAAAVAVAASIFGRESVVFADAGSFRASLDRRLIRPSIRPSVSMSLLIVAVLFPVWFFVQSSLQSGSESVAEVLAGSARLMPVLFVLLPLGLVWYWKIDWRGAFFLRAPGVGHVLGAVLMGASAWVWAHELNVLLFGLIGAPKAVVENAAALAEAIRSLPVGMVLLMIAVIPALCEEFLFRGFLFSGLTPGPGARAKSRLSARAPWRAILVSAAVFGVFHFFLFKFPVTFALGVVLAWVCWRSWSLWPGIIVHGLHNTISAMTAVYPGWQRWLGIGEPRAAQIEGGMVPGAEAVLGHLPPHVLILGAMVFLTGVILVSRSGTSTPKAYASIVADAA